MKKKNMLNKLIDTAVEHDSRAKTLIIAKDFISKEDAKEMHEKINNYFTHNGRRFLVSNNILDDEVNNEDDLWIILDIKIKYTSMSNQMASEILAILERS
jgi:uncharacterized protein YlzI (FlbEa/FlbD family)